jgi:DNA-binding response OmpR family regulator
MSLKLLIAEDDRDLAEVVAYGARLAWPDCRVTIAADGREALARFAEERPDLVVLDVAMPPPNGIEVCQRIRRESPVPILMLTVRGGMLDKVRALDLGADDYLTKPFDHLELFARLRALLRRVNDAPAPPAPDFRSGDLTIDFALHEVRLRGEILALSPIEYLLLAELVRHAGTTLPHERLLDRVWGGERPHDAGHLKVFVNRLRKKLGDDAAHPRYIQTVWGIGYRFLRPQ